MDRPLFISVVPDWMLKISLVLFKRQERINSAEDRMYSQELKQLEGTNSSQQSKWFDVEWLSMESNQNIKLHQYWNHYFWMNLIHIELELLKI